MTAEELDTLMQDGADQLRNYNSHEGQAMRTVALELTLEEAEAVHQALYLRLLQLSAIEDHDTQPARRAQAIRDARPIIRAADALKALLPHLR